MPYTPQQILIMAADLEQLRQRRDEMRARNAPVPDWFETMIVNREIQMEDATRGHDSDDNYTGEATEMLPLWSWFVIGALIITALALWKAGA